MTHELYEHGNDCEVSYVTGVKSSISQKYTVILKKNCTMDSGMTGKWNVPQKIQQQ